MQYIQLRPWGMTIIDDEDYDQVSQYNWRIMGEGYAQTQMKINGKWKNIKLHRFITNAPQGLTVDHINHDRLDNRRSNLRICTIQQNNLNRLTTIKNKYKGVYKNNNHPTFVVNISVNTNNTHIGTYKDEQEGAQAYDRAALYYYGEYATLNFPEKIDEYRKTPYNPRWAKPHGNNQYRGIYYHKARNRWSGKVWYCGKSYVIGQYKTEEEAGQAIDITTLILKGDNVKLNFPDHQYQIDRNLGSDIRETIRLNIKMNLD